MNFKKTLAFLLAAQMVLVSLASCQNGGGEETKKPEESKKPAETTPVEEENPRLSVPDDLPEISFNGRDFRFLVQDDQNFADQLISEEYGIDATSDAIWERNKRIEDRFDAKVAVILCDNEAQDAMVQYCNVGEHVAEICDMQQYMAMTPVCYDGYTSWLDIDYLNFEKPWWNKESIDSQTINGYVYTITGALSLSSMQMTYCLAFNQDLMEDWGYSAEDLYQLVWDGEWTYDKLIEITANMYVDSNNNNESDSGDTFGFGYTFMRSMPWATSIDIHPLTLGEDGRSFEITLATEKMYSFLEKMINFIHNDKGVNYDGPDVNTGSTGSGDIYAGYTDFVNGNIGIQTTTFENCFSIFRDLNFDYGLLPYPKYDTAQKNYYTTPNVNFSVYGIPATLPLDDYDFVGIMMEALNAESWKTVYPAFYDDALKGAYSTDENMAKMVDLITESRVYEFAVQFGQFLDTVKLPYMASEYIRDGNLTMASDLASQAEFFDTTFADLLTYYGIEPEE